MAAALVSQHDVPVDNIQPTKQIVRARRTLAVAHSYVTGARIPARAGGAVAGERRLRATLAPGLSRRATRHLACPPVGRCAAPLNALKERGGFARTCAPRPSSNATADGACEIFLAAALRRRPRRQRRVTASLAADPADDGLRPNTVLARIGARPAREFRVHDRCSAPRLAHAPVAAVFMASRPARRVAGNARRACSIHSRSRAAASAATDELRFSCRSPSPSPPPPRCRTRAISRRRHACR